MNRYVQSIRNFLESVMRCLKEENALDSAIVTVKPSLKSMKIKQKSLVKT